MVSKLKVKDRVEIPVKEAETRVAKLLRSAGLSRKTAAEVAAHLVESDCCGTESHGIVRTLQYAKELRNGKLNPSAKTQVTRKTPTHLSIDANGGIGIPAMRQAVEEAAKAARDHGLAIAELRGAGHTGRLGAFAEAVALEGVLTIIIGGGNRKTWRMVAPYGGTEPLLPTNPYCIGIPGGAQGPVVLDFATATIAGGWIYAAREAGVDLPVGAVIDKHGAPTLNPEDYFSGGAILAKGGQMGSGLALVAEIIGEAMLGPVEKGEINWLILALDSTRYRALEKIHASAEEILVEIRACRPAKGFSEVEVPGERERRSLAKTKCLSVPRRIWQQIAKLE